MIVGEVSNMDVRTDLSNRVGAGVEKRGEGMLASPLADKYL